MVGNKGIEGKIYMKNHRDCYRFDLFMVLLLSVYRKQFCYNTNAVSDMLYHLDVICVIIISDYISMICSDGH